MSLTELRRKAEERVRALEEQFDRLTPQQLRDLGTFPAARKPRRQASINLEERVAALERALSPAPEQAGGLVGIELCPKCRAVSFRVVTDYRCSLPECQHRHQSFRCSDCNYHEIRTAS